MGQDEYLKDLKRVEVIHNASAAGWDESQSHPSSTPELPSDDNTPDLHALAAVQQAAALLGGIPD